VVCGTPIQGDIKSIGNNYYCSDHYEREFEKANNEMLKENLKWFKKHWDR
jgi:hypothetical protein